MNEVTATLPAVPPYSHAPWAIVRTDRLPTRNCWRSGQTIDTPWTVAFDGRATSRAVVESGSLQTASVDVLIQWLDRLNSQLSEIGDRFSGIGLVDVTHPLLRDVAWCTRSLNDFHEQVPTLGRCRMDIAVGLGPGSTPTRVGHWCAHVVAPDLAAFLDKFHGTPAPQRLYTPAERRDRLAAEQRAAAVAAQETRERAALEGLADALFGERSDAAVARAQAAFVALDHYRDVLRQR